MHVSGRVKSTDHRKKEGKKRKGATDMGVCAPGQYVSPCMTYLPSRHFSFADQKNRRHLVQERPRRTGTCDVACA